MNSKIFCKEILLIGIILLVIPIASSSIIWSDNSQTNFIITANSPQCVDDTYWQTITGNNIDMTRSFNDCYRADGQPRTTCCPSNYGCRQQSDNTWKCVPGGDFCGNYNNQADCEGDVDNVANGEVNDVFHESGSGYTCGMSNIRFGQLCLQDINCGCWWDGQATGEKCKPYADAMIWKEDAENVSWSCDLTNQSCDTKLQEAQTACQSTSHIDIGRCTWTNTQILDNCNTTGNYHVTKLGEWTGTSPPADFWCKDLSYDHPCVSKALLSFFDTINLIIAILLIIIFYIVVVKKRKRLGKGNFGSKKKKKL